MLLRRLPINRVLAEREKQKRTMKYGSNGEIVAIAAIENGAIAGGSGILDLSYCNDNLYTYRT